MEKKRYEVVAAVIKANFDGEEKIFCAKRPGPKLGCELNETHFKWEFPGGKIENGESREEALAREILEEFGARLNVEDFIVTVNHEYKNFFITLHAFFCTLANSNERLELREHLESKWLSRAELHTVDWAGADVSVVEKITVC